MKKLLMNIVFIYCSTAWAGKPESGWGSLTDFSYYYGVYIGREALREGVWEVDEEAFLKGLTKGMSLESASEDLSDAYLMYKEILKEVQHKKSLLLEHEGDLFLATLPDKGYSATKNGSYYKIKVLAH